jgi:uncharacterized LabA/DUF88 family protein
VGKNVAVFVDVANIFYAAKAAGTDIDYVTLLKATTAGRDFVRAYAYTGLDPDNENQRNFHAFLARNQYKVVSKDIRKYGDGKVKANLDIELVVDLMKTARNLDIAIVISGDGDFAPAIRAVQEMGVRVEVVSFRGNTSSDLIEVADLFTDITQLARVDKTSSRSGRRVAGDDEDLSMTEVPDKQTEGTGQRSRGRGRGRGRPGEAEPVAARTRTSATRGASRDAAAAPAPVAATASGAGGLTVLPGEKLSRVRAGASAGSSAPSAPTDDEELTPFDLVGAADEIETMTLDGDTGGEADVDSADRADGESDVDGEGRRRRRRRGGRGRGRGRGREGEAVGEDAGRLDAAPATAGDALSEDDDEEEDEELVAPAPRGPRTTPFGSVWDSQLGTPTSAPAGVGPIADDEDFDEPEIPEYLIAEQRRGRQGAGGRGGQQGGRGGARGGRSAYTSAIERERYGRGGGGGINRYPDVSGRERQGQGGGSRNGGNGPRREGGYARQDASYSRGPSERPERSAPRSGDPWSEVPPELEEMLRAQLAQSPKGRRPEPARRIDEADTGDIETMTETPSAEAAPEAETPAKAPARRRAPSRRAGAASAAPESGTAEPGSQEGGDAPPTGDAGAVTTDNASDAAPKRRTTRRKTADVTPDAAATPATETAPDAAATTPRRRTTRRAAADAASPDASGPVSGDAAASVGDAVPAPNDEGTAPAPKRRATRKKAEPA